MIDQKDMPPEYEYDIEAREWSHHHGLTLANVVTDGSGGHYAEVYGPTQEAHRDAEADLLRMVWSLQDGYDPRALCDRAVTAEEELTHVRDRLERTEALLATTKGQRQTAEDNYAIMVERMRAYDEVAADDRQRRLRVLDEFDDLSVRLKRTEEVLANDRKRLAAQTVMIREQQQVIDHLLRPVAVRVLRRITGLVRR